MPQQQTNNLVVIDDEPLICEFVAEVANTYGFDVRTYCRPSQLGDALSDFEPTMVMLDLNMPGLDGVEILRQFQQRESRAGIMLMSGEGGRVLESALRLGQELGLNMLGFLEKPLQLEELEATLYRNWQGQWQISETELRDGLDQGEFISFFQPRIHRCADQSWRIKDVEALVRWLHPRFGLLAPSRFIDLAEALPLISDLTDQVLLQTVGWLRAWEQEYGLTLNASINLPRSQLTDPSLPDRLLDIVRAHDLTASRITLEVTERGTMRDEAAASEILTRCRLKQFSLAMDDFGTGTSSLTHLARLPFNELKIDKSFVGGMQRSASDQAIVRSCIALAHSLGMSVCAEGVESASVFKDIDQLDCDTVQGFWISPAVEGREIPNLAHNFTYRRHC